MFKQLCIIGSAILMALGTLAGPLADARPVLAQSSGLTSALSSLPDSSAARTMIWYGSLSTLQQALKISVKDVNALNGLSAQQRRAFLLETSTQVYYSAFSGFDTPEAWQATYGFDPFSIDQELTVGSGRTLFGILQGNFDAATINAALTAQGYSAQADPQGTRFVGNGAQPQMNNVLLSPNRLIAASTAQALDAASASTARLVDDASYAAVAAALNTPTTVSAVIIGGDYFNTTFLDAVRPAIDSARGQLGLDALPLPRFDVVGLSYRFDGQTRTWEIALVYTDAGQAAQAAAALGGRLAQYTSIVTPAGSAFEGWQTQIDSRNVSGRFVVVATLVPPSRSAVGWAAFIRSRDLGFLVSQ